MHSFYLAEKVTGDTVSISDAGQLHHLRDVLRLKIGDEAVVFDAEGNEHYCVIAEVETKKVILSIKTLKTPPVRKLRLTVACAIPKQSKMDEIIDKLTQLGVETIIPLITDRAVIKLGEREQRRMERWRKIARSASEQSQRARLPIILPVVTLKEVLAESREYQLKLVATLEGERKTLRQALAEYKPSSIFVLIGPEGDFTPREIHRAVEAGFIPVSLGDNVLRVATAAVAVASYITLALEI